MLQKVSRKFQEHVVEPIKARFEKSMSAEELNNLYLKYSKNNQYTPDYVDLVRKKRFFLFVYDNMMMGHKENEYALETNLNNKRNLFTAYTEDTFYHWKKDLGIESTSVVVEDAIRAFVPFRDHVVPARVQGELYSIRLESLMKIDFLRENGLQFFRKKVIIRVPHSKVIYSKENPLPALIDPKYQTVEAWMYIGNSYYWQDQLGGVIPSNPLPYFKHGRDDIGVFTKFEG